VLAAVRRFEVILIAAVFVPIYAFLRALDARELKSDAARENCEVTNYAGIYAISLFAVGGPEAVAKLVGRNGSLRAA
jgi:hypothetical protein